MPNKTDQDKKRQDTSTVRNENEDVSIDTEII